MKDIKKHLCDYMHKFVKDRIDEVENKKDIFGKNQAYESLGFKNRLGMLRQIKNDPLVAMWALSELCDWGMKESYTRNKFIVHESDDMVVFNVNGRYIKYSIDDVIEVSPKNKMVEVLIWEETCDGK